MKAQTDLTLFFQLAGIRNRQQISVLRPQPGRHHLVHIGFRWKKGQFDLQLQVLPLQPGASKKDFQRPLVRDTPI